jgi:DNA-binding NarL/FixJ family response regulator
MLHRRWMQRPAKIPLLIADDHAIVREGLRALLQTDPRMEIVAEAADGKQAIQLASQLKPQVILMDIFLPVINGIEATRKITKDIPTSKVLIFSTAADHANVQAALQCGASGFLTKTSPSEEIFAAIRHAISDSSKGPFLCRAVQNQETAPEGSKKHLSPREFQVLYLIAQGYSNKCIGPELGISIKTVEKHRQSLMKKLNIHTAAGLTSYAIGEGVLQLDLAHAAGRR